MVHFLSAAPYIDSKIRMTLALSLGMSTEKQSFKSIDYLDSNERRGLVGFSANAQKMNEML